MLRRAFSIPAAMVLTLLCLHSTRAENRPAPPPSPAGLYDADPNHLWNRLHRALFVRVDYEGTEYGLDQLDPLLWARGTHLLDEPSHGRALQALDEFLANHGETLVRDPLKRALLQRDLWAVFDWTTEGSGGAAPGAGARRELRARLAAVMARLALSKEEIDALPDNYAGAARSRKFEKDYDETRPGTPFLPADLFDTNGPWVCVGLEGGQRIAPVHVSQFGGRSAFLVFMRTPGGRAETLHYLRQFREFPRPYVFATNQFFTNRVEAVPSPNLPQFPNGTTFALVRQMMLVDAGGGLVPTHLTESAQIRRYNDVHPKRGPYGRSPPGSQSMFEFLLSRKQLFGGVAGGLRAVGPGERDFHQFLDKGFDPFAEAAQKRGPVSLWFHPALDCMECHGGRGVYSVSSFLQSFQAPAAALPPVTAADIPWQRDAARYWKQEQFNWGLLQGLWGQPLAAPANVRAAAAVGVPQPLAAGGPPDPSLLHLAARRGLTNEVELLIAQGADVNNKEFQGRTPLGAMAMGMDDAADDGKYAAVAAILIAHGATVDAPDETGETPLLRAVETGKSRLARVLLGHGANAALRYRGADSGMTPLHRAIREKDKAMVAVLLQFNPALAATDGDGATPLLLAEELDQTEIAAMLRAAMPASGPAPPVRPAPPTRDAMRALARRIADGDAAAFDELTAVAKNLYDGIDYRREHARVMLNLSRMKTAYNLLGEEAGQGNARAFAALKKSLGVKPLASFAPDALGIAAAAGNKEALDILLHYEQWGILDSSAKFALCVPVKAGVAPAIDSCADWLLNLKPEQGRGGMVMSATNALAEAAAHGNQRAKEVLEKFAAASARQIH